jgi:hypothetical protein
MRHPGIIASAQLSAGSGGGGGEEEDDMTTVTIDVSSADIQAMPDTPKMLLAGLGADKVIWLRAYAIEFIPGDTPYEDTTFKVIREGEPSSNSDPLDEAVPMLGFGERINEGNNPYFALTDLANKGLLLTSLDPTGSGNGTAKVTLIYTTLTVSG